MEALEERAVLATLYIDFGDLLGTVAMNENTVGGNAGWDTLGIPLPEGDDIPWITGPVFPYEGNPMIEYTSLADVIQNRPEFEFDLGRRPPDDPFGLSIGNDPFEFEAGPELPIGTLSALQASIIEIVSRMFAPFDIDVVAIDANGLDDARDALASNNRVVDPNVEEPETEEFLMPAPDGIIGPTFDATLARYGEKVVLGDLVPAGTEDCYILIGGWTRAGNQIGAEAGLFGTAFGDIEFYRNFATDPDYGGVDIPYSDSAGAVFADTIIDRALAEGINPNVAIATAVAQLAAIGFGNQSTTQGIGAPANPTPIPGFVPFITHSHDGMPSFDSPFFDADVELLSGSDIMRQGNDFGTPVPTSIDMPFFSRFDMMRGDTNQNILNTQDIYDYFRNSPDFNDGINGFQPGDTGQYEFISGTGAFDHITVKATANPLVAEVTVNAFRDNGEAFLTNDTSDVDSFIATNTYTIALIPNSTVGVLVEGGRNQDMIEIDPALSNFVFQLYGGAGVDLIKFEGNGTVNGIMSPSNFNRLASNRDVRYETAFTLGNNLVFIREFDDNSLIEVTGFSTLTYNGPGFLPGNYRIDTITVDGVRRMFVDGAVGPGPLSPIVGVSNLSYSSVANFIFDTTRGAVDDNITIRMNGNVAAGLQSIQIRTGTGTDKITVDDSFSFASLKYTIKPTIEAGDPALGAAFGKLRYGAVESIPGPGTFKGVFFNNAQLENLTVSGTQAANEFDVTPSSNTVINVNGNLPSVGSLPDGDILDIDFTGILQSQRQFTGTGTGAGIWSFPGTTRKNVNFTGIEQALFPTTANQAPPPVQFLVIAGSSDAGAGAPIVKVYDPKDHDLSDTLFQPFYAYEQTFKGGVRIATADINKDGYLDIITAPGAGRLGDVKIYDGKRLLDGVVAENPLNPLDPNDAMMVSFRPEGNSYKNGLYVAVGDVDNDDPNGNNDDVEIITSIGRGNSKIRVYDISAAYGTPTAKATLSLPYTSSVAGGVVIAAGNVQGDAKMEVIAAPASGAAVLVRVFEFTPTNAGQPYGTGTLKKKSEFYPFGKTFKAGASISAGNADGAGLEEIFIAAGPRAGAFASEVRTFRVSGTSGTELTGSRFKAYTAAENSNAAVKIVAHRIPSINRVLLFTAQGNDGTSDEIRVYDPINGTLVDTILENDADFAGGINLG